MILLAVIMALFALITFWGGVICMAALYRSAYIEGQCNPPRDSSGRYVKRI